MTQEQHNQLVSFVWNISNDVLVNKYNKDRYRDIYCNDEERRQSFGESIDIGYVQAGYALVVLPEMSLGDRVCMIGEQMRTEAF